MSLLSVGGGASQLVHAYRKSPAEGQHLQGLCVEVVNISRTELLNIDLCKRSFFFRTAVPSDHVVSYYIFDWLVFRLSKFRIDNLRKSCLSHMH